MGKCRQAARPLIPVDGLEGRLALVALVGSSLLVYPVRHVTPTLPII